MEALPFLLTLKCSAVNEVRGRGIPMIDHAETKTQSCWVPGHVGIVRNEKADADTKVVELITTQQLTELYPILT